MIPVRSVSVMVISAILLLPVEGIQAEELSASSTTVAAPAVSSAPVSGTRELTTAIGDLNYKIEIIQSRYLNLTRDIDELRKTDRTQMKLIAEQGLNIPDPQRLKSLDAELTLVRSDLAQVREEVSLLKGSARETTKVVPEEKWYQSPWVGVTALGLSIIALLFR
jgi:hypothetical protein